MLHHRTNNIWTALRRLCVSIVVIGTLCGAATGEAQVAPPGPQTSVPAPPLPRSDLTAPAQPIVPDAVFKLPKDLSPWGMFLTADIVVKFVMIGLVFASLVTWTIALAKGLEVLAAKRALRDDLRELEQVSSLPESTQRFAKNHRLVTLLDAAMAEMKMSGEAISKEGVKERVASRLERIEAAAGRTMMRGTGLLATIGATAPFVGLFGTVWGIMNSFIGISRQHTTNLAVVAPGIAEALLATALGLLAAIPAVVIYNMFSRSIASYRANYADATAGVLRLVSRDLDRAANHPDAKERTILSAAE